MVLEGHILCWNEIELVPFVMDYWKRAGVDKLYVYDNGSTDGTLEALKKYDFVETLHFDSEGYTNEFILTQLRNTLWKRSIGRADWVIVSDFDEVPWYSGEGTLKDYLEKQDRAIRTRMPQLLCEDFPEYDGHFLHTLPEMREFEDTNMNKTLTFPIKNLKEINYLIGAHECRPVGVEVMEYPEDFCFYHLKHLGKEYVVKKSTRLYENLHPAIQQSLIDIHYKQYMLEYDKYFEEFKNKSHLINTLRYDR